MDGLVHTAVSKANSTSVISLVNCCLTSTIKFSNFMSLAKDNPSFFSSPIGQSTNPQFLHGCTDGILGGCGGLNSEVTSSKAKRC